MGSFMNRFNGSHFQLNTICLRNASRCQITGATSVAGLLNISIYLNLVLTYFQLFVSELRRLINPNKCICVRVVSLAVDLSTKIFNSDVS